MSKELVKLDHFHMGLLGQSGAGKTEYLQTVLQTNPGIQVVVFCSEISAQQWKTLVDPSRVHTDPKKLIGLKKRLTLYKDHNKYTASEMPITWLVMDDFMPELKFIDGNLAKEYMSLSIAGRHLGIRLLILAHDASNFPKYMRTQFTHMGFMKKTAFESFDQMMNFMGLVDQTKAYWKKLSETADHSVMLMCKGNELAKIERSNNSAISSIDFRPSQEIVQSADNKVNISGTNNGTITQLNMAVQSSSQTQINELREQEEVEYQQMRLKKVRKALADYEFLHEFFWGSKFSKEGIFRAIKSINYLSNYLCKPFPKNTTVSESNWISAGGAMLTYFEIHEYERRNKGSSENFTKETTYRYIKQIRDLKKNADNYSLATDIMSGDSKKLAYNVADKYLDKRSSTILETALGARNIFNSLFG